MSSSLFTSSIMYETCYLMDRAQQIGYFSYKARLRRDINDDWAGLNHDIWVSSLFSKFQLRVSGPRASSFNFMRCLKTTCFLCEVGEFGVVGNFFSSRRVPSRTCSVLPPRNGRYNSFSLSTFLKTTARWRTLCLFNFLRPAPLFLGCQETAINTFCRSTLPT